MLRVVQIALVMLLVVPTSLLPGVIAFLAPVACRPSPLNC